MVLSSARAFQNLRSSSCGVGMVFPRCAGALWRPTNRGAPTLHAAKSGHDPETSPHRQFHPAAPPAERQRPRVKPAVRQGARGRRRLHQPRGAGQRLSRRAGAGESAARISARRPGCSTSWSRRASSLFATATNHCARLLDLRPAAVDRGDGAARAVVRRRRPPSRGCAAALLPHPSGRHGGDDLVLPRRSPRARRRPRRGPTCRAGPGLNPLHFETVHEVTEAQLAALREIAERARARGRPPGQDQDGLCLPAGRSVGVPARRDEVQDALIARRCARRRMPRTSPRWCAGSRRRAASPTSWW